MATKKKKVSQKRQKMPTSKKLITFLFVNCTLIELFVAWVTIRSLALVPLIGMPADFTPLVALIGAVVGEVIGYAVYAIKSSRENSANGIVYELAMKEAENNIQSEEEPIFG